MPLAGRCIDRNVQFEFHLERYLIEFQNDENGMENGIDAFCVFRQDEDDYSVLNALNSIR